MAARFSPTFVAGVLALALASGGTGFAAAKVTSAQIKDETIKSRDVRNGALGGVDIADGGLTGADVADGSLAGADLQDGAVTGTDVADGSLTGADVADGSLTGADLQDRSVTRNELDRACAGGEVAAFGGCVRKAAYARSSHAEAVADCNARGGRLPTIAELRWIATQPEYTWADGNDNNYEFTGQYTDESPFTPIGLDRNGFGVQNASAQLFWHHCVTY